MLCLLCVGDIALHIRTNFHGHYLFVVYKVVMLVCCCYLWVTNLGTFGIFINLSPEAICCCLQTCYVYGVFLTCLANTYQVSWSLLLTLGRYRYI